ncbi:MAG: polysaccharide biosynthesis/export family protein [Terrimicrobiaceae bacterium]
MSISQGIFLAFLRSSAFLFASLAAILVSSAPECCAQEEEGNNYRLSANDLVEIRVYQEPDLDSRVRIGGDGSVTLPLVGTVTLGGKTVNEAADYLRKKYDERFLVNPQLTVTVKDFSKKRFTVLGQVQTPGSYSMPDNEPVTLLQAIGMAGGYTRIAEPSNITVKRIENGVESLLKLNAKRMARGDASAAFRVLPGDVISVPESMF